MKILCELFGHKISGWQNTYPPRTMRYLKYKNIGLIDGCGRMHVKLFAECDRCGKEYYVGNIHLDKNGKMFEPK